MRENTISNKIFTLTLLVMLMCMALPAYVVAEPYDYATLQITLLNQDPDPAEQGEYLDLRFKVEKQGNAELEDITFRLEEIYPFSFDASDKAIKSAGDWEGYSADDEFLILHYKMRVAPDALEDDYDLELSYTAGDGSGWVTKEFSIRVGENTQPEFVLGTLTTSPTKLVADTDEAELNIELENIGDEGAQSVTAILELPDGVTPSYSFSDRDNLGNIAADTSETATFYVDIDEAVASGNLDAALLVSYKEEDDDDNIYRQKRLVLELPIINRPKFELVSVETTPSVVHPGDTVSVKLKIENVGGKEAESVSVRAYKESSQPFDFDEKSDFIGKLKPGEQGEAVISFDVDKDASIKSYLMDLEVRSIYSQDVLTEDERITIDVINGTRSNAGLIIGGLVVALVVIIGIVYIVLKNRPKARKR